MELQGWFRASVWLHSVESDPEPVLLALSLAPSRVGEDEIGKGLWDLRNAVVTPAMSALALHHSADGLAVPLC